MARPALGMVRFLKVKILYSRYKRIGSVRKARRGSR